MGTFSNCLYEFNSVKKKYQERVNIYFDPFVSRTALLGFDAIYMRQNGKVTDFTSLKGERLNHKHQNMINGESVYVRLRIIRQKQ